MYFLGAYESVELDPFDENSEKECQDFWCEKDERCKFWIYNRISGYCQVYEHEIDASSCTTIGGLPTENPFDVCKNATGCDVRTFHII